MLPFAKVYEGSGPLTMFNSHLQSMVVLQTKASEAVSADNHGSHSSVSKQLHEERVLLPAINDVSGSHSLG